VEGVPEIRRWNRDGGWRMCKRNRFCFVACDAFVEALKEIVLVLRTLAGSRSPVAQTAAEMIEEWKVFLR
jgi:hypothetical protein